ncbi:MAG: HDOD domain-containing protein [Geobacter sp.]|nr:HDOD domain-containing protein [Geobacter sp.]
MGDKRQEILSIIKDTRSLPILPGIITKLNALAQNSKSSIQEMARLVSSDQVLSARVLRLVNSPSYGFYRVSTISNAMILLGIDVVKCLALSTSIFEIMEQNIMGLWEHSLGTGVAANVIACRLKLAETEEISTAGLNKAELELLGIDHSEVGGWLANAWYLPEKLVEPIMYHHDVSKAKNHQVKTAVVHLADVLVKASGFGFSGDDLVPQIQPLAWQRLNLNEQLLEEIVEEIEDRLIDTKNFSMELQEGNETRT